jgi:hypothetical protein
MNLKRFLGYCLPLHCLVGRGGRDIEVGGEVLGRKRGGGDRIRGGCFWCGWRD